MPDTSKSAPEASNSPAKWVDASEAARLLGVSEKTVWRRAKAGTLEARKVARGRGGFVWEIALEATGQASERPDKSDRTPTGQNGAVSFDSLLKATGQPDKSDRPTDRTKWQPTGQNEEMTARLLAQLEGENAFLRGVIEQLQRDGAETRNALKKALELTPKQLAAPSPSGMASPVQPDEGARNEAGRAPNIEVGSYGGATLNGAETGGKSLTYGDIADALERMLNGS